MSFSQKNMIFHYVKSGDLKKTLNTLIKLKSFLVIWFLIFVWPSTFSFFVCLCFPSSNLSYYANTLGGDLRENSIAVNKLFILQRRFIYNKMTDERIMNSQCNNVGVLCGGVRKRNASQGKQTERKAQLVKAIFYQLILS